MRKIQRIISVQSNLLIANKASHIPYDHNSSKMSVVKTNDVCVGEVREYHMSSPLGTITVTACTSGLHTLSQLPHLSDENFSPNIRQKVELLSAKGEGDPPKAIKSCLHWLQVYFKDPAQLTQIPVPRPNICHLHTNNPGFRAHVWQVLADTVGPGQVITYGALANRVKNPGAVRAVGSAMSNNPVGLIVPCHRVIRSNGLGLYHHGQRQAVKRWLLHHEGVHRF